MANHPVFVAIDVNRKHISLILTKDATGTDFGADTEIEKIKDTMNPKVRFGGVTEWGTDPKRLPVKLIVLRHPDQGHDFITSGPDTGSISITLSDGTATPPTVDDFKVAYVAETQE